MDSLSYLKMNVLHFHISDFCRFSIQSTKWVSEQLLAVYTWRVSHRYPQLTAGLEDGQFYTKKDILDIVEYAKQRGIRVIPEIELP